MKQLSLFLVTLLAAGPALAQVDCNQGMEPIDSTAGSRLSATDFVQTIAAREQVLVKAFATFGYSVDIAVQTLQGDSVDGEFHQVSKVAYNGNGVRRATVTSGPTNTLSRLKLSDKDVSTFIEAPPFVLKPENLVDRDIVYSGRQKMGDLNTSVFDVLPRAGQSTLRAFQGRTWVLARDSTIVKICGRSNASPIAPLRFESQRQPVGDQYWFPALVRADEDAEIGADKVHVRVTVKYSDYQARP